MGLGPVNCCGLPACLGVRKGAWARHPESQLPVTDITAPRRLTRQQEGGEELALEAVVLRAYYAVLVVSGIRVPVSQKSSPQHLQDKAELCSNPPAS